MNQQPKTYISLAVANFFVQQSQKTGTSLTPMKLLKLVYIAHGWCLALFNKPLITEAVEAWDYGPVIPRVYDSFKSYRASQITDMAKMLVDGQIVVPMVQPDDEVVVALLEKVWSGYGKRDALYLSTITHLPNTPWSNARSFNGKNAIITQDAIKAHYTQLSNANRATAAVSGVTS